MPYKRNFCQEERRLYIKRLLVVQKVVRLFEHLYDSYEYNGGGEKDDDDVNDENNNTNEMR